MTSVSASSNGNESSTEPNQDGSRSARPAGFQRRSAAGFGAEPAWALAAAAFRSPSHDAFDGLDGLDALDAEPEPEAPLRSRTGGVNKPRPVVPTPVLTAEAVRLVEAASVKRARKVTAFGLPAVVLAASGVAVLPTVANAASAPSNSACPSGQRAEANPAAAGGTTAPGSAPSSSSSSAPK